MQNLEGVFPLLPNLFYFICQNPRTKVIIVLLVLVYICIEIFSIRLIFYEIFFFNLL